jgi:hypothetical protein
MGLGVGQGVSGGTVDLHLETEKSKVEKNFKGGCSASQRFEFKMHYAKSRAELSIGK